MTDWSRKDAGNPCLQPEFIWIVACKPYLNWPYQNLPLRLLNLLFAFAPEEERVEGIAKQSFALGFASGEASLNLLKGHGLYYC